MGKATWHLKEATNGEAGGNNTTPPARRMVGTPRSGNRRSKENAKPIESVVFVPMTPGSKLQKLLQKQDDKFSQLHGSNRWRYVERVGAKLKDALGRTNPWGGQPCPREECWPCRNPEGKGMGDCQAESVVYRIECKECKEVGITVEYIGESSMTLHTRSQEHLRDLRSRKEDSTLWLHCQEAHEGMEVEFEIGLVRKHRTPFGRQTHEQVAISTSKCQFTLNRKDDWNSSKLPRLVVEVRGEVVVEEGEKGAKRGGAKKNPWKSRTRGRKSRPIRGQTPCQVLERKPWDLGLTKR